MSSGWAGESKKAGFSRTKYLRPQHIQPGVHDWVAKTRVPGDPTGVLTEFIHRELLEGDFCKLHHLLLLAFEEWFVLVLVCLLPQRAKTFNVNMLWNPSAS